MADLDPARGNDQAPAGGSQIYAGGMPGGPDNPLGARTLYLYHDGRYTLYTIYASSFPETIGTNLTSGCTGLLTQDMIDLYDRTAVDTKVVVLPA